MSETHQNHAGDNFKAEVRDKQEKAPSVSDDPKQPGNDLFLFSHQREPDIKILDSPDFVMQVAASSGHVSLSIQHSTIPTYQTAHSEMYLSNRVYRLYAER